MLSHRAKFRKPATTHNCKNGYQGELSEHLSDIKALARRRTKGRVVA